MSDNDPYACAASSKLKLKKDSHIKKKKKKSKDKDKEREREALQKSLAESELEPPQQAQVNISGRKLTKAELAFKQQQEKMVSQLKT